MKFLLNSTEKISAIREGSIEGSEVAGSVIENDVNLVERVDEINFKKYLGGLPSRRDV